MGEAVKKKIKADEDWLKKVLAEFEKDILLNPLERFKGVTRNLAQNALKSLEELKELCNVYDEPKYSQFMDKIYLLEHYLDYLVRFCEGRA